MTTSVTLSQFRSEFDVYKDLVKNISVNDIKILWFSDYYDGILSGLVEYEEQMCWIETLTDHSQAIRPRVFAVLRLTEEQIKEEQHWQHLFEKYVAYGLKSRLVHHLFYEPYQNRPDPNYGLCSVIAWYIEE